VELAPGLPLALTFPENRPNRRTKLIGYLEVAHYSERLRGAVETSVRAFRDDQGVTSTTLDLAWRQRLGAKWIFSPFVRWYQQSAADYYHPNLDATPIIPVDDPADATAYYSSDYRLSAFDATTLGAKLTCAWSERWGFDLAYERYTMRGRDGVTSASAYCTANILTVGLKLGF
jgi:hypothetical protein